MNCECVYFNRNANRSDLEELIKKINKVGETCELYPVSISKLYGGTVYHKFYDMYDQGRCAIHGTEGVFVQGKLHNMRTFKVNGKTFCPRFPEYNGQTFYEDIVLL